jgi:hypothetical protein
VNPIPLRRLSITAYSAWQVNFDLFFVIFRIGTGDVELPRLFNVEKHWQKVCASCVGLGRNQARRRSNIGIGQCIGWETGPVTSLKAILELKHRFALLVVMKLNVEVSI